MATSRTLSFVVAIATLLSCSLATKNVTRAAYRPAMQQGDSLSSLGDITTKLVTTLVEAEGETVDIYGMANLVTALSKAATIVDHPDMYKDMTTGDLEGELAKLSATVKALTEQQTTLQEIVNEQRERLQVADEVAYQLNQSKALVDRLVNQLDQQDSDTSSDFVGFTAWADVSDYYSSGSTIKFPRVLFNYGSAYDQYTSKFTCPYSGVYSVNAHLEERNNGGLLIKVMLDSDYVFKIHVHDDSTDHGTSATSGMVGCRKGQQIYVLTEDSGSDAEIQSIEKRTVFSVFLIRRMGDQEVRSGNLME